MNEAKNKTHLSSGVAEFGAACTECRPEGGRDVFAADLMTVLETDTQICWLSVLVHITQQVSLVRKVLWKNLCRKC